jgi:hypothetical protein
MEINFPIKKAKLLLSTKVKEFALFVLETANIALFSSENIDELLLNCLYGVVLFLDWNSSVKIVNKNRCIFSWTKWCPNFFSNISLKLDVASLRAFDTHWYFSSHFVWADTVLLIVQ